MLMRFIVLLLLVLSSPAHAGLFSSAPSQPLPPEQAFRLEATMVDAATLEMRWQIAEGYYLYRDKFKLSVEGGTLGAVQFPVGEHTVDENFGKVEIYRQRLTLRAPLTVASGVTATLKAVVQGCWDGGICYPPLEQTAQIIPTTQATPSASPAPTFKADAAAGNETSQIAALLRNEGLALTLLSFFGFGLLLSLTPCMFPMIPILSGIIVNHGHALTPLRAFFLSSAYVLGMAATYAAVGVAAGFSGTLLTAALQNVWVLSAFALVFVALALAMFGVYELQMPSALQSRLSSRANPQGGSMPAIALMGALSALIVGPCVAAPLAGALLYIAQTGDALLGGTALFTLALGMGAPLVLVGAFSPSLLPKSGPWMATVNKFFGVLMLAMALWFISPVLPIEAQMLGWSLLLIVPAVYLRALDPLPPHAHAIDRLLKGLAVVILAAGVAMLAGVLGGAKDPLRPLEFLRGGAAAGTDASAPKFIRIKSSDELDQRLRTRADGKPVMLDFYADWCVSCKEMERLTFADPQVAARLRDFVLLQADVTANTAADKVLLRRFELFGPPGIVFFDTEGREQTALRVVGFQPAAQFLSILQRVPR
ncbi:MAG TPA: protein-disulfide reductase DsbD [Rhodocyclaceae bacterium]|nr:protein-disulfide reductase DsbD [Rhodocyclaceae bacterium]